MTVDFFKSAINLKKISRQGWINKLNIDKSESVADHSFMMTVMSMVISDLTNQNSEKIMKMALLHDLAESKIGDYVPGQIDKEEKIRLENNAFMEIVDKLPNKIKIEYLQLWKEYQENISEESKIIHQIDKLEMSLQAKTYQKEGHPIEKLETFFNSAKNDISNPTLKKIFLEIVMEKN